MQNVVIGLAYFYSWTKFSLGIVCLLPFYLYLKKLCRPANRFSDRLLPSEISLHRIYHGSSGQTIHETSIDHRLGRVRFHAEMRCCYYWPKKPCALESMPINLFDCTRSWTIYINYTEPSSTLYLISDLMFLHITWPP